ncbi:MAG: competence/damage-inducible protein A [Lachnospiraceae bacterium]
MVVEFISVGTEILMGNIVNTNAAFLAKSCNELGMACNFQEVVGDNEIRLEETLKQAMKRAEIIILSGGLGPTEDDLTKEVVAKVCNRSMYMDEEWKEIITEYFKLRNAVPTENNWKQALVPEEAIVIKNDFGTAPGLIVCQDGVHIILLPGPPSELKPMFEDKVKPYLQSLNNTILSSKTIKICGIGESKVEDLILDLVKNQTNPTIATYAGNGEVHIRVTASAETKELAKECMKPIVEEIKHRFGNAIFTTKVKVTFEQSVIELLKKKNFTIATAESCSGGLLAGRIINSPGASSVFKSGVITYSNEEKMRILNVKEHTLKEFGAVSEEVASEMAKNVASFNNSDVGISITGIAGPDGGTEEKPVGLVYIGCFIKGKVIVRKYHITGMRNIIREASVARALTLVRDCILENE